MKFKKKKGWVSPERYEGIIKMLTSKNEEDFLLGAELCKALKIKPVKLLNQNTSGNGFSFRYVAGELMRSPKYPGYKAYMLSVDKWGNIIEV